MSAQPPNDPARPGGQPPAWQPAQPPYQGPYPPGQYPPLSGQQPYRPYVPPVAAPAPAPVQRGKRRNWGLRLAAGVLSALAFLGFWQLAAHAPAASATPAVSSSQYAPASGGQGGLVPPSELGGAPHASTRVS